MNAAIWHEIGIGVGETLYMSVIATLLSYVIGLPLGIILAATDKHGLKPNVIVNKGLGVIVNILRSIPFLILFVTLIPLTRVLVGTTIGAPATIVALVFAASPFVARLTETSFKEVDSGVIEAALACGASTPKILIKVVIPEALPSLISNAAIAFVTVIGYSAMAGFCGGGGLGAIAINYGYYRGNTDIMIITVVIIVAIVQIFQESGLKIAKLRDRRKKHKNK
ncbi:MAG: ABC transporter permease [Clostridia bacterium]|nr:ABC transporter permease [Clostridia bacterium]